MFFDGLDADAKFRSRFFVGLAFGVVTHHAIPEFHYRLN
jgi:hypothetical protein